MPFTNYTYDFKGVIDYIFYPRRSMQPLGILGPIDQNYLRDHKIVGCPTAHMPSDHFSLYVELAVPLPLGSAETLPLLPPTSISSSSGPHHLLAAHQMNNNLMGGFGGPPPGAPH